MMPAERFKGEMNIKAKITKELPSGILRIPDGWAKANADELTELEARDSVTGYAETKSLLCKISTAVHAHRAA